MEPQPNAEAPISRCEVLVVGAGPTGLTLANLLAQMGVEVRIVERTAERMKRSKALGVHARTLELLDRLGLAEELVARGQRAEHITFFVDGKRLLRLPYHEVDSTFPYMLLVPQYQTEQLLESRLEASGTRVARSVECVELRRGPDTTRALLRYPGGREELVEAEFIVGCDGARSTVRQCIGLPFEGAAYEETFLLADIELGCDLPTNEAYGFTKGAYTIGLLPLPDGRFRLLGSIGDAVEGGDVLTRDEFVRLVRETGALPPLDYGAADWVSTFRVHHRLVTHYRMGRVFLAGDAAHIHSPAGGQGLNVGIQDAFNLAWKLAAVLRDGADESLLDSYEAERRPVAKETIEGTDRMTKLVLMQKPLARVLRDLLVPLLLRSRRALRVVERMSNLSVGYRTSPWVVDLRQRRGLLGLFAALFLFIRSPNRPTAGDRLPDAPLPSRVRGHTRLHQLLDTRRHTLFAFPSDAASVEVTRVALEALALRSPLSLDIFIVGAEAAAGRGPCHAIPDASGALRRRLGARRGEWLLVRPDGYLGFAGPGMSSAGLDAYVRVAAPEERAEGGLDHGFA